MSHVISFNDETEKVYYPKIDRSRLYSSILVIISIITIYISIMTNKIWITFFIVIPFAYISRAEEQKQGNRSFLRQVGELISQLAKLIFICVVLGFFIFLLMKIGILYTVILIYVSFKLYTSITAAITRKNFEKYRKIKSEVF